MNSFVILNGLKLRVFWNEWSEEIVQPRNIIRFVDGSAVKQFGRAYRRWGFTAKVHNTPPSGFATFAQVKAFFDAVTNSGNTVTFVDPYGATWTVAVVNDMQARSASPMLTSAQNYYYVPFQLEQVVQ